MSAVHAESDRTPLRFAVVGCGNIARTHAQALRRLATAPHGDRAELVACVDAVPERASSLASEFGARAVSWEEVLADPAIEAITVCTPSGTHAELGIEALAAGKHVIVEKPMDISLTAARELQAAATSAGRTLGVISQHRFDPATEHAAGVLARGELGDIVLVDARIAWWRTQAYYDADSWRGTWAVDGGGALINQGIHTVDLMLALAGQVERVRAASATRAHDIEVEDVVCAMLTFASGAVGTLAATTAAAPGFPARLAIHGAGGTVVIEGDSIAVDVRADGSQGGLVQSPSPDALIVAGLGSRAVADTSEPDEGQRWGSSHERQLADFVSAVRDGRPPRVSGVEGLRALELVEAVYAAARTGQQAMSSQ